MERKGSKFDKIKSWKELETTMSLDSVLAALARDEKNRNYRSDYNKRKNLRQKLIMKKIESGEINIDDIEAEVAKIA